MENRVITAALAFSAALGLFLAARGAFCQMGQLYVIDREAGASVAEVMPTPPFEDAGAYGWTIQSLIEAGSEFYIYQAEANTTLAPHRSPDEWIGYVLGGFFQLRLMDEDGAQESVILLRKGDTVVFRADTMHAWKVGAVRSCILFVKPRMSD
jgi:uncharacterized cupin superfamily protein